MLSNPNNENHTQFEFPVAKIFDDNILITLLIRHFLSFLARALAHLDHVALGSIGGLWSVVTPVTFAWWMSRKPNIAESESIQTWVESN
jgi:hypothetical protein